MRFTEPSRLEALHDELCLPQASPDLWPPCRAACPVGTDARGYLEAIAYGRYGDAFRIAREPNPIVAACAWICHHPCERECRRKEVDEALAIRNLKRVAIEQGRPAIAERGPELKATRAPDSGHSVAVVGSGPAGLAAAESLALAGHSVTIFERRQTAGGQLANTIPLYRLPRSELDKDIAEVAALGVTIKTGVEVGSDVTLESLSKDHDAVVLGIGLSSSRSLPIEGIEHDQVLLALPFLEACAREDGAGVRDRIEGKDVIVIGGGNVAVDVARCAMRLGPNAVRMVCLESESEMPAWDWEVEEAADEGVVITCSRGPKRVVVEGDACAGLETKAVKSVFNAAGQFAPEFFDDKVETIPGQAVIVAIGQMADYVSLQGSDVAVDERGRLTFDPTTLATSVKGVFACGEVVTGPGAAIEAAASGKRAASAVDTYLRARAILPVPHEHREKLDPLPERIVALLPRVPRQATPHVAPAVRKTNAEPFELGLTEAAALKEARRCMLCGAGAIVDAQKCATCVTCERVCPFGVPSIQGSAWAPALTCQACGICVVECPAAAIDFSAIDAWEAHDAVSAVMSGRKGITTLYIACSYHRGTMAPPDLPADSVEATVTCAGRVRVEDVLHAYELGASKVIVAICDQNGADDCRNRDAGLRAERRLGRVAELLPQIGLEFDAFEVVRE